MRHASRRIAIALVVGAAVIGPAVRPARAAGADVRPTRDYPVQPVPFTAVRFTDAFWLPRIQVNRSVTIPFTEMGLVKLYRVSQPTSLALEKGYARLDRRWKPADVVELVLPMPVRRVAAHPMVEADQGRVALQRGPLVYAAEWADNPGGKVRNLLLPDEATLSTEFLPGLLNGVQVVTSRAVALAYDAEGKVTRREQDFTAVPYYAWANRGPGEMTAEQAN